MYIQSKHQSSERQRVSVIRQAVLFNGKLIAKLASAIRLVLLCERLERGSRIVGFR